MEIKYIHAFDTALYLFRRKNRSRLSGKLPIGDILNIHEQNINRNIDIGKTGGDESVDINTTAMHCIIKGDSKIMVVDCNGYQTTCKFIRDAKTNEIIGKIIQIKGKKGETIYSK